MSTEREFEGEIEGRLRLLELTVRCFGTGIIIAVGGLAVSVAAGIPRYQRIFEEMLGTQDKLPGITRMVINGHGVLLLGSIFAMAVGVFFAIRLPKGRSILGFGVMAVLLVFLWILIQSATVNPMMMIIQGMAGG